MNKTYMLRENSDRSRLTGVYMHLHKGENGRVRRCFTKRRKKKVEKGIERQ